MKEKEKEALNWKKEKIDLVKKNQIKVFRQNIRNFEYEIEMLNNLVAKDGETANWKKEKIEELKSFIKISKENIRKFEYEIGMLNNLKEK